MIPGFTPESDLERALLREPELRRGWAWGRPRRGHPEGAVGNHVAAMLAAIAPDDPRRAELRLLTLLHDTFKFRVQDGGPWSPGNDHAELARRFAARHGCPEAIATTLALHDAPFWVWHRRGGDPTLLAELLERAPDADLLIRFVRLDAATLGKDQRFLRWFDAATAEE
jgi:hypothetical protein